MHCQDGGFEVTATNHRAIGIAFCAFACLQVAACQANDESATVATADSEVPAPETEPVRVERYEHQIDLLPVIKRFMTPEGYMDPEFPPTVAEPSRFLTDFYGVQAIGDVTRDEIVDDFVPAHAAIVEESEHSVLLEFEDGFEARFFPVSSLSVMGLIADISHVKLSGETWQEARANVARLLEVIAEIGRTDAYLLDNPWYEREIETDEQMTGGVHAPVKVDPDLDEFLSTPDAILLASEAVHGKSADAERVMEILETGKIDWIGLEMLNLYQKQDIEAFNEAEAGTPEYAAAREKLVEYFADAWNGRAGPRTTGEENYYFKLCEIAHANGARVIPLEGADAEFLFFRYGETMFGGAVRSYVWAEQTPASGRGILFGGGMHFKLGEPINAQDFIHAGMPERPLFSTTELRPAS